MDYGIFRAAESQIGLLKILPENELCLWHQLKFDAIKLKSISAKTFKQDFPEFIFSSFQQNYLIAYYIIL